MRPTLPLLVIVVLIVAGCARPGDDTPATPTVTGTPEPTPTPTPPTTTPPVVSPTPSGNDTGPLNSSSYQLAATGMPGQSKAGAKFNFTLFANGTAVTTTDHVGAHYADNDTTDPPVTPGRKDCEHVAGTLPGEFLVNCTLHEPGTWFVWGHARVNDSGELRNWWAEPAAVKVRDYNLSISGLPSNAPTSKSNFTFTLTVTGVGATDNATTSHLGAHFWNASTTEPTIQNSAGACQHEGEPTGAIGTFTITCSIENNGLTPKDHYLRGHLRLTEGATTLDWWGPETTVSIIGVVATPLP